MDAHPSPPEPSESPPEIDKPVEGTLSAREIRIFAAIAEAAMPPGRFLEGAGAVTVEAMRRWLSDVPDHVSSVIRSAAWAIELSTLPTRMQVFSSLSIEARMEVLAAWEQSPAFAARMTLRVALSPLKQAHYERAEMFKHVDCRFDLPVVRDDKPRWLSQVTNGREVEDDLDLECEVVVVGTGAGGAAAAFELASRGRAVLMVEEGDLHRRSSFDGRVSRTNKALYRDQGLMFALGNAGIPIWAGRAVGGSTLINSGTCYRTPERTLRTWRDRMGLPSVFSSEGLGPYFERVESMLGVSPANPLHVGAIGGIIAKGAARFGYQHGVLRRNAPGCDGQGVCCFGCPTGAKRSTDVSYVPEALLRGAQLVTGARIDSVDIVAGRARGVTGELSGARAAAAKARATSAKRPRLRVRAEMVVVAGGTLMTPLLLRRSGACLSSGTLGKNLSIHPASKVVALFDERVDQWKGIPQGYAMDEFADEGLMFEGGSLPFDVTAISMPWTGRRFTELMESYRHLATFGFMIQDESRGEVRPGVGRSPLLIYNLNRADVAKMQRGFEILIEVYLAAGAKRVFPFVSGSDEVSTREALDRLKARRLRAGDFDVAAFHPLGTCAIGVDPRTSCLGPDHEAHDVAGLYVCDGSAVPSSLGVNPQMTIMAMALRAAEIIDARLG